jgi:hypothetical protein
MLLRLVEYDYHMGEIRKAFEQIKRKKECRRFESFWPVSETSRIIKIRLEVRTP